jgi:uncharacterized protein YggT (Ycf19 family)
MTGVPELVHAAHSSTNRTLFVARLARVVDYLFGVLLALLLVRLLLEFLGALRTSGFFAAVSCVTDPFYAPFKHIVPSSFIEGAPVVWPLVIAMIGYALLHVGIRGLLRLIARG